MSLQGMNFFIFLKFLLDLEILKELINFFVFINFQISQKKVIKKASHTFLLLNV